jgi:peptide methionine sulfoxide reductase MsrB
MSKALIQEDIVVTETKETEASQEEEMKDNLANGILKEVIVKADVEDMKDNIGKGVLQEIITPKESKLDTMKDGISKGIL